MAQNSVSTSPSIRHRYTSDSSARYWPAIILALPAVRSSSVITLDLIAAKLVLTDESGNYALTEIGEQLKPAMHPLLDWSLAWEKTLRRGS